MNQLIQTLISDPDRTNALAAVANVTLAVLALIVAIVSIVYTRRSLASQTRHNVLSVKPIPFLHLRTRGKFLEIELVNNGLGPLFILEYDLSGLDLIDHNIAPNLPKPVSSVEVFTTTGLKNRVVPQQEGFNLIKISPRDKSHEAENYITQCLKMIGNMSISIKYTDIYGTVFDPYQKKLDWFLTQSVNLGD